MVVTVTITIDLLVARQGRLMKYQWISEVKTASVIVMIEDLLVSHGRLPMIEYHK
jgi:hypothetical protein